MANTTSPAREEQTVEQRIEAVLKAYRETPPGRFPEREEDEMMWKIQQIRDGKA